MKIVELFSGCGGFSRGIEAAGLSVAVAYDYDPILSSAYSRNFPKTKSVLADVSELQKVDVVRDAGGPIDGIVGGPPCQGFSTIGKRHPDDPRRLLLGQFFRHVAEQMPKFFIMENVVGLQQGDAKQVLKDALDIISESYEISAPMILEASEFGAATKRPRVFVIGFRKDLRIAFSISDLEKYRKPAASVADAIRDLENPIAVEPECLQDTWKLQSSSRRSAYAKGLMAPRGIFTGNARTKHSTKVIERFKHVPPGTTDKVGRHPRLSWDGQCPTLRAGTGSDRGSFQSVRPIHPDEPRVITVREAARLQGFPDHHYFHPTVWHSFRMIGNSVSPFVSEAVCRAVKDCLLRVQESEALAAE